MPMFIAMDRPQHTGQRRTVAPKFTPSAMADMEDEIRQRTGEVLDRLPRGKTFDWVDEVSIELTTGMLAILFGFLLQWPTILTLAMFPVLVWMYVRLAIAEEREAERQSHGMLRQ